CALSDRARLSARLLRLQAQVRSRRWVVGECEDLKRSPRGDHRASDVAAPGTEGLSDCRNSVRITAPLASVVCRPRLCPVVMRPAGFNSASTLTEVRCGTFQCWSSRAW